MPGWIFLFDNRPARLRHVNHTAGPVLAAILTFVSVGRVTAAELEGSDPFPFRNSQPIQLLFLRMFGERTKALDSWHNLPNHMRRSA
ncbi:MAG: hypothetical protein ACREIH_02900 [Nitrospiraceae bacterium]